MSFGARVFGGAARAALPLILLAATARPAAAQEVDDATRAAARKLGYVGVQAYDAKDYATATDKLEKAFRLYQAPSLGLWSARALVKAGKLVEAQERYLKVTRLPVADGDVEVQKKAEADAAKELSALYPRVPTVVIQVEGASANSVAVTVDGAPLAADLLGEARPIDPGAHQVVGTRGTERVEVALEIAEGEQKSAVVHFPSAAASAVAPAAPVPAVAPEQPSAAAPVSANPAPVEASPGSGRRTLAWVSIGVGAAGLVFGGVTGAIAMSDRSSLRSSGVCFGTDCGTRESSKVDSYNSMRTLSSVGFIAGGVLAGAGVVLLLTAPKSHPESSAALFLAPASAGIRGTF